MDRAADLSPAEVREDRREQWHADVFGATEVGVPPRGLVLGMVLTAAFHRSARPHPGGSMTALHTPHGRAARLLITAAVLSVVTSSVLQRTVFFVWTSTQQQRVGGVLQLALGVIVPVTLVLVALSRVAGGRRRWAAAVLAVAGSGSLLVGAALGGSVWVVCAGVGFAGLLAAWFVANQARTRIWWLVAAPAVVLIALDVAVRGAQAALDVPTLARSAVWETERMLAFTVPLVVTVVVALALPFLEGRSDARRVTA
ncbi:hypothetical protein DEJ25_08835 [Curtobacterium sp. MCPF17_011]|nr:hypothetical protein DEJ25_08835 [Curtobacterium sp. MCPF17_011]